MIDSTLEDGHVTYGEVSLDGEPRTGFLLSTTICHPALANDNLSGIVVLAGLARILRRAGAPTLVPAALEPRDDRPAVLAARRTAAWCRESGTGSPSRASATRAR